KSPSRQNPWSRSQRPHSDADFTARIRVVGSTLPMWFFLALVVDGALAGAIYALIALAFVLVYKASHMINFALGEWVMFGALLSAVGTHLLGLGTAAGLVFAGTGMVALAAGFCRLVLRRLLARPVLWTIMVTLGLGMVMRGIA